KLIKHQMIYVKKKKKNMSCSRIKSLEKLRFEGAIGEKRIIQDVNKFNEVNDALTELAYSKYGVGNNKLKLFSTEPKYVKNLDGSLRYILRVEPNEQLFNILQSSITNKDILELLDKNKTKGLGAISDIINLFNDVPELAEIGNYEEYSEYLDSIYPDTTVKDIVFHGTAELNEIDEFKTMKGRTYFSDNPAASQYAAWDEFNRQQNDPETGTNARVIPAIVNLTNPKRLDGVEFKETEKNYPENDGVYSTNTIDPLGGNELQIAVFNSNQVHILGNKADIEGFRAYNKSAKESKPKQLRLFELLDESEQEKFIIDELDTNTADQTQSKESEQGSLNEFMLFNNQDQDSYTAVDVLENIIRSE